MSVAMTHKGRTVSAADRARCHALVGGLLERQFVVQWAAPNNVGCMAYALEHDGSVRICLELLDHQTGADVVFTNIMVDPALRGNGIGRRAVADVIAWAVASGLTKILAVQVQADGFWARCGFERLPDPNPTSNWRWASLNDLRLRLLSVIERQKRIQFWRQALDNRVFHHPYQPLRIR